MSGPREMLVFDQRVRAMRKKRAAATLGQCDFLHRRAAEAIAERLDDFARNFEHALVLGAGVGHVRRAVSTAKVVGMIEADISLAMIAQASATRLVAHAEALPFDAPVFDLVISFLDLHHLNDVPGALIQCNRVLKPDGLFLGITFGGATLAELREVLAETEIAGTGGVSPRVSPMVDMRDYGALLQRAGFALPVTDVDRFAVRYPGLANLMVDLRGMGETNILCERSHRPLSFDLVARASALYAEKFSDPDGLIRATFELVMLTGWAPHESQQKPLLPGSARTRLADALRKS